MSVYGMVATFKDTPRFFEAVGRVREAGYRRWDTYTPFPVHGLGAQMGMSWSKVPYFTFCGGLLGFFTGMLITWYMGAFDYPLTVGGKPFWDVTFPFPIFYELAILFGAFHRYAHHLVYGCV